MDGREPELNSDHPREFSAECLALASKFNLLWVQAKTALVKEWPAHLGLLLLICGFAAAVFHNASSQPVALLSPWMSNVVFDADAPQIFHLMHYRDSPEHLRTSAHPLFSVVSFPVFWVLKKVGLSPMARVGCFNAAVAVAWLGLLYGVLRRTGSSGLWALLFTALAAVSSSAIYFFSIPETYGVSSLTLLLPLLAATLPQQREGEERRVTLVSAVSLSMTVSNWMAGILLAFTRLERRRALQATTNALVLVLVLFAVQSRLFPRAEGFVQKGYAESYLRLPSATAVLDTGRSFFFHSLITPQPGWTWFGDHAHAGLSVQAARLGTGGPWGMVGTAAWALLLAWGLLRTWRDREPSHQPYRLTLSGVVVGQLLLHCLYGAETFLYSLHFTPLLILLAAYGGHGRMAPWRLGLCSVAVLCCLLNNAAQYRTAMDQIHRVAASLPEAQVPRER